MGEGAAPRAALLQDHYTVALPGAPTAEPGQSRSGPPSNATGSDRLRWPLPSQGLDNPAGSQHHANHNEDRSRCSVSTARALSQMQKPFKVSTGLKNLIGQELITNDFVAVFELVKNSFDAHADSVHVWL